MRIASEDVCMMQMTGVTNPDEVLTAVRELPASAARDQDRLVPLVAEVVKDGEWLPYAHET